MLQIVTKFPTLGYQNEMTNIGIIGLTSYIGGRLAKTFTQHGISVRGTYRTALKEHNKFFLTIDKVLQTDVTSDDFIDQVFSLDLDTIVYCVSLNHSESEKV